MPNALIGSTGFVGGNLLRQKSFDDQYHSKNIDSIRGRSYGLVVCAGAPAAKWIANRNPEADLANLRGLMENLGKIHAEKFLLISTIDVYRDPQGVDESTSIDPARLEPYGRHRFQLEQFVRQRFGAASIVRLPGLFGKGLKKNFIYDLLHNNALDWTHRESVFQFYDLADLWRDLQIVLGSGQPLVNFSTPPIKARDLALSCFGIDFTNVPDKPPARYDMRSRFGSIFGASGAYMCSFEQSVERIRRFVQEEKRALSQAGPVATGAGSA